MWQVALENKNDVLAIAQKQFFVHNFFPFGFRAKRSSIWYYNQSPLNSKGNLGRTSVQPRQSTVFGKSVLRNSTNSSSKCPFHQVTKRNV